MSVPIPVPAQTDTDWQFPEPLYDGLFLLNGCVKEQKHRAADVLRFCSFMQPLAGKEGAGIGGWPNSVFVSQRAATLYFCSLRGQYTGIRSRGRMLCPGCASPLERKYIYFCSFAHPVRRKSQSYNDSGNCRSALVCYMIDFSVRCLPLKKIFP